MQSERFIYWKGLMILVLVGCVACGGRIPRDALELSAETLAERRLQTRVFDTGDERMLLSASAGLFQDLGYQLDETEPALGILVASRDRDVRDAGQIAGAVLVAILTGVATPVDDKQKVIASLSTRPVGKSRTALRITFQHMVWNTRGELVKSEAIGDSEIYETFFSKLSKACFLEAQGI